MGGGATPPDARNNQPSRYTGILLRHVHFNTLPVEMSSEVPEPKELDMGSIYKATNTYNNKAYIGQTRHDAYKTRIKDHFAGRGNRLVKQAVEKYGKEAFIVEILHDGIIPEFLNTLEQEAIAKHNTLAPQGYNLTKGGAGCPPSEVTRQKISQSHKGKTLSAETRRKISEAGKGRTHSAETRRKMSEAQKGKTPWKGKTHSAETRRKMSEAQKGKTFSPEHKRKISQSMKGGLPWNKGKTHSRETCQKMSESLKGRPTWNKGKPRSPETKRKISEKKETPERATARELFFSLPSEMSLKAKRKILRQRFPDRRSSTIRRWCKKFESET